MATKLEQISHITSPRRRDSTTEQLFSEWLSLQSAPYPVMLPMYANIDAPGPWNPDSTGFDGLEGNPHTIPYYPYYTFYTHGLVSAEDGYTEEAFDGVTNIQGMLLLSMGVVSALTMHTSPA